MDEKQKARINKYLSTLYDVRFRIPKEREAELKSIATETFGMSLQQFILSAIDDKIATKLPDVAKFASPKVELLKKTKDSISDYYDSIFDALRAYWSKENDPVIEANNYSFTVSMSRTLTELLQQDFRSKDDPDFAPDIKPSQTMMFYSILDDRAQKIICIMAAMYVKDSDLADFGITVKEHTTLSRLLAYQQHIVVSTHKYKNAAEKKRFESVVSFNGIPYTYIFPIKANGKESFCGKDILPDNFLCEVWNMYINALPEGEIY